MKKGKPYTRRRRTVAVGLTLVLAGGCEVYNNRREIVAQAQEVVDGLNDLANRCSNEILATISDQDLGQYIPPLNVRFTSDDLQISEELASKSNAEFVKKMGERGLVTEIILSNHTEDIPHFGLKSDQYSAIDPTEEIPRQENLLNAAFLLPSELIKVLHPRIRFVNSIDREPHDPLRGNIAGTFDEEIILGNPRSYSEIIIVKGYDGDTLVHEIGHALQAILCHNGSEIHKTVFALQASGELHTYIDDDIVHIDDSVTQYDQNRQYPESYGAKNPHEHWATMFEDLIMKRGIVLKGDPDWGTPYHDVQSAMIRDIENQFPGFITYITKVTALHRMDPSSPFNKKMRENLAVSNFMDDTAKSLEGAMNLLMDLYKDKYLSIRYLKNATVIYNEDPEKINSAYSSLLIKDPIIAEDFYGRTYLAYTIAKGAMNDKPTMRVIPYQPERAIILDNGGMSIVEPGEADTITYIDNAFLAVNGQQIASLQSVLTPDTAIDTYVGLLYTTTFVSPKSFNEMLIKNDISEMAGL